MQRRHDEQMAKYNANQKEEAAKQEKRFQKQQMVYLNHLKAAEDRHRQDIAAREKRDAEKAKDLLKLEKEKQKQLDVLKKEQEKRLLAMEKQHQTNKKQHQQEIEGMKEQMLNENGRALKESIQNKDEKRAELQKKYDQVDKRYRNQTKKITIEKKRLIEMRFKDVQDGYVLVLLGRTGTGKSVLTNRLAGDDSDRANEGPARTSRAGKSCTTAPEISTCTKIGGKTLYTVDSGGFADTEDRDENHTNMLCKFLRGCGGINAFVLTVNCADPRITRETKEALKVYEECFGADFYKRVIIVGTHVDADSPELDDWKDGTFGAKSLRTELVQALKLNENKQLSKSDRKGIPVVPIGVKNYTGAVTAIHSLLKTKLRFKITHPDLNSPLDKLEEKNQEILKSCEEVKEEMDQFVSEVSSLATRLDAVQKKIIEKGGIPSF